tara:strand:- start:55 stop:618 length:564 start_codon:yes stop_codon:yes gene_type:complete
MRTLFFFLVLVTSLTLNAQITKGNWLVGGNGSFYSTTVISEDSFGNEIRSEGTSLRLNPNIGYFFYDKFAIGLDVSLSFANSEGANNSNWALGVGPFARYYFLEQEKRINIFGAVNLSYSMGLSEINNGNNSTLYGLSTGAVLFFNSSVGLELSLNYSDTTSRRDGSADSNFRNLFVTIGFQIHLEK